MSKNAAAHAELPGLVFVSELEGEPVYTPAKGHKQPEQSLRRASYGQLLRMGSTINGSGQSSLPPIPEQQIIRAPNQGVKVIPLPDPPFPNIPQGRSLLGYTTSQWASLYGRAQDLVRPYLEKHVQNVATPSHLRVENSLEIVGPLEQEFPDLKRCVNNWGVKWVVKKARHAVSVKDASERRKLHKASIGGLNRVVVIEDENNDADDTEEDVEGINDGRRDNDSTDSIYSRTNETNSPETLPENPPPSPKVEVPEWHKYMTPKYTQGRGPSIYGLTKPIVPFIERSAGPPSMRHINADPESNHLPNTKRRVRRLSPPVVPLGPPVIINPNPAISGAAKQPNASLEPFTKQTAKVSKLGNYMSTPVLSNRDYAEQEDSHSDPMQVDEQEEDQRPSTGYHKSVPEFRQIRMTPAGPVAHTMGQHNTNATQEYVLPPIRGIIPSSTFEEVQKRGEASRVAANPMLAFSNVDSAGPGWNLTNSFPRFDQLAGSATGGGNINILNIEPESDARTFNYDSYGNAIGGAYPNACQSGPIGGQNFENEGQGGLAGSGGGPNVDEHYHHGGFNPNGIPYDRRLPSFAEIGHYGFNPSASPHHYSAMTPNGGDPHTVLDQHGDHSITSSGINPPPSVDPHSLYDRANLYRRSSYGWGLYNPRGASVNGSNSSMIGNESTRTVMDNALPRPAGGASRLRGRGSRPNGVRHAFTWSGNPY